RDDLRRDRIVAHDEHDWNARSRGFGRTRRHRTASCEDHGHPTAHQTYRQIRQPVGVVVCKVVFDRKIAAFDVAGFAQTFDESQRHCFAAVLGRNVKISDYRNGWLPCTRSERTAGRRATEEGDKVTPPHSITSSARASNCAGTCRPSALAG